MSSSQAFRAEKCAHTNQITITKAENQPTPINILQARVQWISGVAGGGLISVNLGHTLSLLVSDFFLCVGLIRVELLH